MDHAVTGHFATRREAEMVVEKLVQEHGVERIDIMVRPQGETNTTGTEVSGGDSPSQQQLGAGKSGEPKLAGAIEVSVRCKEDDAAKITAVFEKAGA